MKMEQDLLFGNKRILVIVPHQDDELNLVGPLIPFFKQKNFVVHVLFTTNGDYGSDANIRLNEANKVANLIGIDKISLLGYPDSGPNIKDNNIYNCKGVYESNNGRKYTCGVLNQMEYCYLKNKNHNELKKESMVKDIKEYILEFSPFVVFCVDCDNHPDHKIASLVTDEAMVKISKIMNPPPLYLKGFCYLGTWWGRNDYFSPYAEETLCEMGGKIVKPIPYAWNRRISFPVNPSYYQIFYKRSLLYKAYKLYSSQNGHVRFFRCVNSNKVFWFRDLSNINYDSSIVASSGDVSFLNDGKLIDFTNVRVNTNNDLKLSWHPNDNDNEPKITIILKNPSKYIRGEIYHKPIYDSSIKILIKTGLYSKIINMNELVEEFVICSDTLVYEITISFITNDSHDIYVDEIQLFSNNTQKQRLLNFISIFPRYKTKKRFFLSVKWSKFIFRLTNHLFKHVKT